MIDDTLLDAEERMDKALSVAREDLGSVRTGRAAPVHVQQDRGRLLRRDDAGAADELDHRPRGADGGHQALRQQPARRDREGIRDSDLGVNPTNDGQIIRVVFPQLTEERRRDLVKMARAKGEDARVAIRNIRRRAKEELDRIAKDGEAGEDEVRRAEKELDDLTAQHVHHIDEAVKNKETELLEV